MPTTPSVRYHAAAGAGGTAGSDLEDDGDDGRLLLLGTTPGSSSSDAGIAASPFAGTANTALDGGMFGAAATGGPPPIRVELEWGHGHARSGSPAGSSASAGSGGGGAGAKRMRRNITMWGGVFLIAGTMIGSGIFASPGSVLLHSHSPGLSLVCWTMAGVVASLGALSYAELGTMLPTSGGEYAYLGYVYGDLVAFAYTWTTAVVTKPASLAIITLVGAQYLVKPFYVSSDSTPMAVTKPVAVALVWAVTLLNSYSVSLSARITGWLTVFKSLALVMIALMGLVFLGRDGGSEGTPAHDNFSAPFAGSTASPAEFGLAVIAGLWSFDGWNNLNLVTEEVINPSRNLPRSITIAMPLTTLAYVLVNVAYYAILPLEQIVDFEAGTTVQGFVTYLSTRVMKAAGKFILPLCIAASAIGAANGGWGGGG